MRNKIQEPLNNFVDLPELKKGYEDSFLEFELPLNLLSDVGDSYFFLNDQKEIRTKKKRKCMNGRGYFPCKRNSKKGAVYLNGFILIS